MLLMVAENVIQVKYRLDCHYLLLFPSQGIKKRFPLSKRVVLAIILVFTFFFFFWNESRSSSHIVFYYVSQMLSDN